MILAIALLLAAAANEADGGVPADNSLEKELQQAIQADTAAKEEDQPAPAPAPRCTQSMNPDISAILDTMA